jgi:hypothetical protein
LIIRDKEHTLLFSLYTVPGTVTHAAEESHWLKLILFFAVQMISVEVGCKLWHSMRCVQIHLGKQSGPTPLVSFEAPALVQPELAKSAFGKDGVPTHTNPCKTTAHSSRHMHINCSGLAAMQQP